MIYCDIYTTSRVKLQHYLGPGDLI